MLFLERGIHARHADGEADRVIGELIDVGRGNAVALVVTAGRQVAQRVGLPLTTEHDPAFAEIQRPHGLHVHGTGQALSNQRSIRRLVYGHAADQFGRVLVELDTAVVAGRDLFAPVQQRARELLRHAADMDHLRASIDALHGQARQARNRIRDADVGQLADIFRRDRLHDRRGLVLGFHRARDGGTDAGDLHRVERLDCLVCGLLRLLGLCGKRERQCQAARHGQRLLAQGATSRMRGNTRCGVRMLHLGPSPTVVDSAVIYKLQWAVNKFLTSTTCIRAHD